MNFLLTLYIVALFFVLTPGVFLSLPPGGDLKTVALTHALVFGLVYHFTHKTVLKAVATPVKSKYYDDGKKY